MIRKEKRASRPTKSTRRFVTDVGNFGLAPKSRIQRGEP
jgi:hypothetical protein